MNHTFGHGSIILNIYGPDFWLESDSWACWLNWWLPTSQCVHILVVIISAACDVARTVFGRWMSYLSGHAMENAVYCANFVMENRAPACWACCANTSCRLI